MRSWMQIYRNDGGDHYIFGPPNNVLWLERPYRAQIVQSFNQHAQLYFASFIFDPNGDPTDPGYNPMTWPNRFNSGFVRGDQLLLGNFGLIAPYNELPEKPIDPNTGLDRN